VEGRFCGEKGGKALENALNGNRLLEEEDVFRGWDAKRKEKKNALGRRGKRATKRRKTVFAENKVDNLPKRGTCRGKSWRKKKGGGSWQKNLSRGRILEKEFLTEILRGGGLPEEGESGRRKRAERSCGGNGGENTSWKAIKGNITRNEILGREGERGKQKKTLKERGECRGELLRKEKIGVQSGLGGRIGKRTPKKVGKC